MKQQRQIARIRLDGFRGHRLDVPLAPLTVLTGPNMSGKTSVLDGAALALTGRLPGAPVDQTGMTECDVLGDCAPASGRFAVEVEDNGGQRARFEVSVGDAKITRNVGSTLAEGRKNDWHRAAIAKHFGTGAGTLGLVSFDLESLRSLEPAELERLVMQLCGDVGATEWTTARLLSALAERTMAAAGGETTAVAWGDGATAADLYEYMASIATGDKDAPGTLGGIDDVRAALGELRLRVEQWRSDAESAVRRLKTCAETEVPAAPNAAELADLLAERDAMQAAVESGATELGRLEGELLSSAAQREAQRAELDSAIKGARADYATARREVESLERRNVEDERDAAACAFAEAEADVERLTAAVGAPLEVPSVLKEAVVRTSARVAALEEKASEPSGRVQALVAAAEAELEAARAANAASHRSCVEAKGQLDAAIERARCVESGVCPTCYQPTLAVHETRAQMVEEARARLATIKAEALADKEREDTAQVRLRDVRVAHAHAVEWERSLEAARAAAREAAQAEAVSCTAQTREREHALALAVARQSAARERLEALTAAAESHEEVLGAARNRVAAAEKRGQELALALHALGTGEGVSACDSAEVTAARITLAQAREQLAAVSLIFEEAKGRHEEAGRIASARDAAAAERAVARAQSAFWRAARAEILRLEREVFAAFVAPLVGPVNDLLEMAEATDVYGRFAAHFGARFALGFEREDGSFAPLTQLSDGHFLVAVALIVTAIHHIIGGPYRGLSIDRAEALDRNTRGPLLGMLTWLLAEGHLDQVLIGAVDADNWGALAEGVTVVNLEQVNRTAEAAAAA